MSSRERRQRTQKERFHFSVLSGFFYGFTPRNRPESRVRYDDAISKDWLLRFDRNENMDSLPSFDSG